jgi:hypothetical protein
VGQGVGSAGVRRGAATAAVRPTLQGSTVTAHARLLQSGPRSACWELAARALPIDEHLCLEREHRTSPSPTTQPHLAHITVATLRDYWDGVTEMLVYH